MRHRLLVLLALLAALAAGALGAARSGSVVAGHPTAFDGDAGLLADHSDGWHDGQKH